MGPGGPGALLTGSWQDTECECLLELLTILSGAVRTVRRHEHFADVIVISIVRKGRRY